MDISLEGSRATRVSSASSILSAYRPSYTTRGGRPIDDEVMDSSINFGDHEITFGGGTPHPPSILSGSSHVRSSHHHRSMTDIFLAEDGIGADDHPTAVVGMQPTEHGNKMKRWTCYLIVALLVTIIFVTVPQPGFIFGNDSSDNSGESVDAILNATMSSDNNDATTPEELIEEESGTVTKPPQQQDSTILQVDMNRPQAIQAFILENKVSTVEDLNQKDSAAAKALDWLATSDPAELDVPGYKNDNNDDTEEQGVQLLQRYALACFYFAMEQYDLEGDERRRLRRLGNPSQKELDNRLQFNNQWTVKDSHVCDWFGVDCDDENHVINVRLANTLLEGTLVPEIFQDAALPHMTALDLSHNALGGTFPSQPIYNRRLKVLNLEHNQLTHDINAIPQQFHDLMFLDLQTNQFSATLPTDWSKLSGLVTLKLTSNAFQGTLPKGMAVLTEMEWFQLEDNQLTGSIPDEFEALTRLETMKMAHNQITGSIPTFLGLLPLHHLALEDNLITGQVPTDLGLLTGLVDLHLQETKLQGTMPHEICSLLKTTKRNGKQASSSSASLITLSSDCKEPEIECSCCTLCY